ncbi:MAG: tetratricopeptide repeat protein [Deltaproteobacteria bacterium]|nr:tetratricopeptide repeat protein [Deltaproteobacteria bacterium]
MSDFGFDAYGLDDAEPTGHPHPLEIASDLIAAGKPHAALEMLTVHHEQLADDPEYLLLCAEAWRADGDTLRAQQALLGAARLAPEDPRPLEWLGELLAERGEHDKAERVLEKARALLAVATQVEEPLDEMGPEAEDDLIAFAERQERRGQAVLTPRQIVLGTVVLAGVALLITGIAWVTSAGDDDVPAAEAPTAPESVSLRKAASPPQGFAPTLPQGSAPTAEVALPQGLAPTAEAALPQGLASTLVATPEPEPPALVEPPQPVTPRKATAPPRGSAPAAAAKVTVKSKPKAIAPAPAQAKEPDAALVQAELASMDPRRLTARADALHAQGHIGVAASYYRRALELDPDYAPALVGMGQSILRAKKYSDAMRNASRALQLARGVDARPGLEAAAIYQMGRVHYERGERDAARRLFRQSISLPGTPPEAWFYLGEALSSDNSPAAREAYERYLEFVPEGHLADRARRAIQ